MSNTLAKEPVSVEKARTALLALTVEQRAELFKELGTCRCAHFDKLPSAARTGALFGGLLGAALGLGASKSPPPTPEERAKIDALLSDVEKKGKTK